MPRRWSSWLCCPVHPSSGPGLCSPQAQQFPEITPPVIWVPFRSYGAAALKASRWLVNPTMTLEVLALRVPCENKVSVKVQCNWGLLA